MRRKPSDYRQPAWLLRTGVWAAALLYSCVVALANTFPRLYLEGQDHGWPFTYMVRDVQPSDADMSSYYGPWPLYEEPLIQFRAAALIANAVIGVALAAIAGAIASYWLRNRGEPIRFGLRGLFVVTAIAGCVSASLLWIPIDRTDVWELLAHAALLCAVASYWCVYIVPVCAVITIAHRIGRMTASSPRKYRMAGLHWVTCLAAVFVTVPFFHFALFAWTDVLYVSREHLPGMIGLHAHGWPFEYRADIPGAPSVRLEYAKEGWPISYFDPVLLVADIVIVAFMIATTVIVVERWIRRTQNQSPTGHVARLATIAAVAVAVSAATVNSHFEPAWYDYPSWLFAMASTVYAILLLAGSLVSVINRQFSKRS